MKQVSQTQFWVSVAVLVILVIGGFVYLFIQLRHISAAAVALTATTQEHTANLTDVDQKVVALSDALYAAEQNIGAIQARVGGFETTVGTISGTVGTLEKLSKTDPQLLQKYSKVFFLNENYTPERLVEIDKRYVYDAKRSEEIHALVWPHLKSLLDSATSTDVALYIRSAYRSFTEQSKLKSAYSVTYGAGSANQFSADQGYSEHQLGTAVDFITTGLSGQLSGFEKTPAYLWMLANAYKYGFILSYPKGNGYYIFEPWHWRYVGVELATYLHSQNKHFYDLEQRQIDAYLVNIFD